MKQIDPNHHRGIPSGLDKKSIEFKYGFFHKIIIKLVSFYMKRKTQQFLNFSYTKEDINPPKPNKNKQYLLYIHIPFCKTLCPYCSFHKFKFQERQAREYFKLLREEMQLIKNQGFDFISLYVGGGTTTILPDELAKTIDFAKELFSIKDVSCEGDPLIDEAMIEFLSDKVDRLSIGIQSTDDEMLKKIKRFKKFGSSKEQLSAIQKAIGKFPILNVDLIFNLPNQTKKDIEDDLDKIVSLHPEQISYYPLMYSPSVKKGMEKNLGKIHNDNEAYFYNTILNRLSKEYKQISSWAFSKKDIDLFDEYVVEYNEYIGLGSGSFSFIEDTLYINTFSLKKYQESISKKKLSLERYRKYKLIDILQYQIMLDLFSNKLVLKKYKDNYNIDIESKFKFEFFVLRSLGVLEKNSYKTTSFGNYFFLTLMKEFYIGMDYIRETSRSSLNKKDKQLQENKKNEKFSLFRY